MLRHERLQENRKAGLKQMILEQGLKKNIHRIIPIVSSFLRIFPHEGPTIADVKYDFIICTLDLTTTFHAWTQSSFIQDIRNALWLED